jgi:tetratricopeptide (TPR) repeat protein
MVGSTTSKTTAYKPHPTETQHRTDQNTVLVWIDGTIDPSDSNWQRMLDGMKAVVNTTQVFTRADLCHDYLRTMEKTKALVITSGSVGRDIVPKIHGLKQVDAIYIFCADRSRHAEWTQEWVKVKGVHTTLLPIREAIEATVEHINRKDIAISFVSSAQLDSTLNLDQLEPSFMYTQLFQNAFLAMEHDEDCLQKLVTYCKSLADDHLIGLPMLERFAAEYHPSKSVWWYTSVGFLFRMLNQSLRCLDASIIVDLGFFIRDLHQQIDKMHREQLPSYHGKPFTVYRGQGLSTTDFQRMCQSQGGLISFNSFLSTTTDPILADGFAVAGTGGQNTVNVLFVIAIDPTVSSTPFANIRAESALPNENEILFTMDSVFRIVSIESLPKKTGIYQVQLKLTSDDDQQLRCFTEGFEKDIESTEGWYRIGRLLMQVNQLDRAIKVFSDLLNRAPDEKERATYFLSIASAYDSRGEYPKSLSTFETALAIREKALPANHPNLATTYNNVGSVYYKMGKYTKALPFYQKALAIWEAALFPNHPSLATLYHNIGLVHYKVGEYPRSLPYFERAVAIREKALPAIHPSLATSYNNIGLVHYKVGDYRDALSYFERSLTILETALPANHPELATSYNNIGLVYSKLSKYPKALSFFEKALAIWEAALSPNHPSLAKSNKNIGLVYYKMGKDTQALSFYGRALAIREKALPPDHPSLATSYHNIGLVYCNMGKYTQALSLYERALAIKKSVLSVKHPSLASSYNNIGFVYDSMGEYTQALSFYKRAVAIQKTALPANHHPLGISYNNIGLVYYKMGKDTQALSFYGRALAIWETALPPDHPSLATSYHNIGLVYCNMGKYTQALSLYERALAIKKSVLSVKHPSLASSYNNIGFVYDSMGEYPKALSYYERALAIRENALPADHPDFATTCRNIGSVYSSIGEYSKALSLLERARKILKSAHRLLFLDHCAIRSK